MLKYSWIILAISISKVILKKYGGDEANNKSLQETLSMGLICIVMLMIMGAMIDLLYLGLKQT
ncbi:hypothetical protein CON15_19580 [Bacillus cereus]|uniref:Uncharacterized protein n=1 Tax=Bacillus thuringiensis TaxID=1428 RepID=A0A9X6U4V7_BACTU|nr:MULTISPECIES: hypothetical protein [Bacillus cereus group]MDO6628815.1 hypothetical protein [Bacillus thuringiensis]MDO6659266.1 hypothetical protein [Bacillus thuringiensis]MDO6698848.1 hypothetical protein [Bacillus thuringiensis]PDZ55744.1 hypothetical protein CON15_19580 [Bacillus cereus]PED16411.1 hypothetical protein CON01_00750 [Bacillus thuringiensis]